MQNFFWVPTARYFGRRPVFVFTSVLFFATLPWAATTHNWNSLLASRIIMAFAGSATEALPAAIVSDLFFLHERGFWMGAYSLFLSVGAAIGAIISGFIISGVGYRWVFWVSPPSLLYYMTDNS